MNLVMEFYEKKQRRGKEEGSHRNRTSNRLRTNNLTLIPRDLPFSLKISRDLTLKSWARVGRLGAGNEEELAYLATRS